MGSFFTSIISIRRLLLNLNLLIILSFPLAFRFLLLLAIYLLLGSQYYLKEIPLFFFLMIFVQRTSSSPLSRLGILRAATERGIKNSWVIFPPQKLLLYRRKIFTQPVWNVSLMNKVYWNFMFQNGGRDWISASWKWDWRGTILGCCSLNLGHLHSL